MRQAGVSTRSRVVVYDDAGGSVAARLWWLLRGYGHAKAHVLDGGYPGWLGLGRRGGDRRLAVPTGDFAVRSNT